MLSLLRGDTNSEKEALKMDGFTKGMITGMLLGAGAAAILQPLDRRDMKRMKHRAEKAARAAGDAMDHIMH